MKRKINLLLTLTLVFSFNLFGQTYNKQNTYIDALKLKSIKEQNIVGLNIDNQELYYDFYEILSKYGINETNIESNIFLKDLIMKINPLGLKIDDSMSKPFLKYSKSTLESSTLESANLQASAINGLANFMAGRFKQEILHITIDQIFKQIKTESDSQIVKSIFPKTFKQIETLYGSGSSSYYTADLLLLRQTAQIDIEQLPKSIIKNTESIFSNLKNEPRINDMLTLGYYIVEYSQQGQSLDHLLSSLASEKYSTDSTIFKILNVADLFSQALLDTTNIKNIWVNPINKLPATSNSLDNLEIKFFYGLLFQQLIQIPEFKSHLERQGTTDIVSVANKMQELANFVNKLNNTYNYIRYKEFNLKSPEEIITYMKEINQALYLFISTLKQIPETGINDSILDISTKYISIVEALMNKDYQKVIPLLLVEFGDYIDTNVTSTRTLAFVSQLATIESADDMEVLLNSYALPIGSSSIKRRSSINISVNGYVGLNGGWETAYGTHENQTRGNIGLSAPIGISATFCNGYLTPFVSFIDLGSIVNQRLNNDTTSYSSLRFEHFFTPGIGLFVNHPKLPITMGVHFYYIPNLRTIKYESGNAVITESNRSVTRINFSILVDIPFFTLYNREIKR